MKVTGVNEDTVEFVFRGLGPVGRLVEKFVEVNFKGEFETIVDLQGEVRVVSLRKNDAHLNHGVPLHVVLVALQLQMQHWRE